MPSPYEHLFDGTISHSLTYVGIALMTGHATWRAILPQDAPRVTGERTFFLAGSAMALLGALVNLRQASLTMTGALDPDAIRMVLTQTQFGQSLLVHVSCLLLAIATGAWLWRSTGTPQQPLLWLPVVFALLGQSLVGHASAEGLSWPLWAYALHVMGAVAWLGGILAWLNRLSRGYTRSMTRVFAPFSRFARGAMLVLLPAGLAVGVYFIPRPSAVVSPYGIALAIKLLLVVLVLALALGHHRTRFPRIRSSPGTPEGWKRFDDALLLEASLGILIVVLAAMLSQIPPPEA